MDPQKVLRGPGSLERLREVLGASDGDRVLVFHGSGSYHSSGARKIIDSLSGKANWAFFSDIPANPQTETVNQALRVYQEVSPNLILAVGGGSVIDTAKAVLAFAGTPDFEDLLSGRILLPRPMPQLVVVPTTAGSGSEATHFAVLYHGDNKYSLAHPKLLPGVVILDAKTTLTCPPFLTAASGADAVCQAVESYWNKYATPSSRELSLKALSLLLSSLGKAINSGSDIALRQNVLEGAHAAGRAINLTKTTAGHALSYALTTGYGLPHGFAVLLVMRHLVPLMDQEFACFDPGSELAQLGQAFESFGDGFADAFVCFADSILAHANLPAYLPVMKTVAGLDTEVLGLSASVNIQRLGNHPMDLSGSQIQSIYRSILTHNTP